MDAFVSPRLGTPEFELHCADGPDTEWVVTAVALDERLDSPYRAQVDLACTTGEHAAFLGSSCELAFLRDTERRRLAGIVAELESLGVTDHRHLVRLVIVPAFALLGQGSGSRIWQQVTVRDIVEELLGAQLGDRTIDFGQTARGKSSREMCVQYRESVRDFVARLLAEEGIGYRFEHGEGPERLCFQDHNNQLPEFENTDCSVEVPIIPDRADEATVESIQSWMLVRRLTPTAVLRRDFDWRAPRELLTSEVGGDDDRGRSRLAHAHGRRRFFHDDLDARANDLLESLQLSGSVVRGTSNAMGFAAGIRFYLASDDEMAPEGEYVVTRVEHHAAQGEYHNEFECVPIDVPLRPPPRPHPRVHGPQTAIVVGDEGEDVHTDEHGRVRVQFHWELEPTYGSEASCWIRCAQSLAGPGLGAQFIPRVGMEVVVEFLEGNPDRPLITGCVYDGDNTPPFTLPDEKTKSGWRTRSVPGPEGYHELSFEDTAGAEVVHLRSQKDLSVLVLASASHSIGSDESVSVGHDQTVTVGNDRKLTVSANHHEVVGDNRTMTIAQNLAITVGANRSDVVAQNSVLAIAGAQSVKVGQDGAFEAENATWKARTNAILSSGKQMTLDVGDKLGIAAAADINIAAKAKAELKAAEKLTLTCGDASIVLKSNGDITITGKKLTLKGSADIVLQANKVKNN